MRCSDTLQVFACLQLFQLRMLWLRLDDCLPQWSFSTPRNKGEWILDDSWNLLNQNNDYRTSIALNAKHSRVTAHPITCDLDEGRILCHL